MAAYANLPSQSSEVSSGIGLLSLSTSIILSSLLGIWGESLVGCTFS